MYKWEVDAWRYVHEKIAEKTHAVRREFCRKHPPLVYEKMWPPGNPYFEDILGLSNERQYDESTIKPLCDGADVL